MNAVYVGFQGVAGGRKIGFVNLHLHQHGNRLQIVFDAMVHFTHDGRVGDELCIFDGQSSLIGQR